MFHKVLDKNYEAESQNVYITRRERNVNRSHIS